MICCSSLLIHCSAIVYNGQKDYICNIVQNVRFGNKRAMWLHFKMYLSLKYFHQTCLWFTSEGLGNLHQCEYGQETVAFGLVVFIMSFYVSPRIANLPVQSNIEIFAQGWRSNDMFWSCHSFPTMIRWTFPDVNSKQKTQTHESSCLAGFYLQFKSKQNMCSMIHTSTNTIHMRV